MNFKRSDDKVNVYVYTRWQLLNRLERAKRIKWPGEIITKKIISKKLLVIPLIYACERWYHNYRINILFFSENIINNKKWTVLFSPVQYYYRYY